MRMTRLLARELQRIDELERTPAVELVRGRSRRGAGPRVVMADGPARPAGPSALPPRDHRGKMTGSTMSVV
jgi:hypothetical protein